MKVCASDVWLPEAWKTWTDLRPVKAIQEGRRCITLRHRTEFRCLSGEGGQYRSLLNPVEIPAAGYHAAGSITVGTSTVV